MISVALRPRRLIASVARRPIGQAGPTTGQGENMEHAIVTTDKGYEVEFYEADLALVGGTVEVEVQPEVFETQTIVRVTKYQD